MALTPGQEQEIENWVHDTHPFLDNDLDDFLDWIDNNYEKFEAFRDLNDELHDRYMEGTLFGSDLEDLYYRFAEDWDGLPEDDRWRFYH